MELIDAVLGALETQQGSTMPAGQLLLEITERGFSAADARLGIEQALMQGLIIEGQGGFRRSAGAP